MKAREFITEAWSQKYKSSINCSHPKGFSQRAHCAGKKKHNESKEMEMVCEDCGMCQTHGDHSRANLNEKCWDTHKQVGMKNKGGRMVPDCVPKESVTEDEDAMAAFVARGGEIQQLKPQRGPKRSGVSLASKHIGSGSGRGTTKGKVSGLGANTGKSGKPVVTAEQGMAEDLSRRGFLKGAGAAAVAGAAGSAMAKRNNKLDDPMAVYLMAWCKIVSQSFEKYNAPKFTKFPFKEVYNISHNIDLLDAEHGSEDGKLDFEKWKKITYKGYDDAQSYLKPYHNLGPQNMTVDYLFEIYDKLKVYYSKLNNILATKESVNQGVAEGICSLEEAHEIFDDFERAMAARGLTEDVFETITDEQIIRETAAWRRKAGKSAKGGLNAKGVASYRAEHPGSKLQMAVTTKPSKLKPGSKAAKRRKSFCARMSGVKGPMKKPNGKPTRKALALRKWNC